MRRGPFTAGAGTQLALPGVLTSVFFHHLCLFLNNRVTIGQRNHMRIVYPLMRLGIFLAASLFCLNCNNDPVSDEITDAEKVAALQGVNLQYNGTTISFILPGLIEGKSFDSLVAQNPAWGEPSNYTINLSVSMTADNISRGTNDAQFDGINVRTIFGGIDTSPIYMSTEPVTIPLGQILPLTASSSLNLATYKPVGRYIIAQLAANALISTISTASYHYDIGQLIGDLTFFTIPADIPTTLTSEEKAVLVGLLNSGKLD
jgi:hypothetical protein